MTRPHLHEEFLGEGASCSDCGCSVCAAAQAFDDEARR